MSLFDYKHLKEEEDSDAQSNATVNSLGNSFTDENRDALISSARNDGDRVLVDNNSTDVLTKPTSGTNHKNNNPQSSPPTSGASGVRYTPLRPTRVVEEGFEENENDDERNVDSYNEAQDPDSFGSYVHLTIFNKRRAKFRRFHILLCVLLFTAAVLIAVSLLLFLVVFPSSHGTVMYSDGHTHVKDLATIKKLGKNVVVTSCGLVRGTREDNAYVFKAIPYASPPTGKRRWNPPEALSFDSGTCWHHILNATQFGNKCVQPSFNDSSVVEGSEDCLYLNIWTPSLKPEKNYPVMVWLHSGDLIHGSGHMPGMSPSAEVAKATKAVFVSLNYRLGALGFLALDVLRQGREFRGHAGNYGIMDQQLALKWIQENIRHFGGNQFDVTVFGHGSGATSIQALLSSRWSYRLFHKAWLSSPVAIVNKTLDESCRDNEKFMVRTKCTSDNCLRSLSVEEITKASPWSLDPFWTLDQLFHTPLESQIRNDLVIYDGHTVSFSSEKEGPAGVDVSVVLGTTYFEISNLHSEKAVIDLTDEEFNDLLVHHTHLYGTDLVIQMKRLYSRLPNFHYTSPVHFPPHPTASLAHLVGDVRNVCPLKLLANSIDNGYSSPVYMYTAEIYPSHNLLASSSKTNSFLGWDMIAFFNGFNEVNFQASQGDINFRNLMRQEIMSFIRTGKPISSQWKTVNQNTGIMEQGVTIIPSTSDYFDHCQFWDLHQFFGYTWRDKP